MGFPGDHIPLLLIRISKFRVQGAGLLVVPESPPLSIR